MIKNFNLYKEFKESSLYGRYITNDSVYKLNDIYSYEELGKSIDNRPVYYFKLGSGKKKILIWSQMHGNESTSTRALFDALSYFLKIDNKTLSKLSLHIIPILNPDGASKYTRENANNTDLNRDAFYLTQTESIILKDLYDKVNPDFCFNLHDQRSIYSVSDTKKPSILSFSSPSADVDKYETGSRIISMRIISSIANRLSELIPGYFSRYNDDFNKNCVGDTFQSLKTPTILFESGHFENDYSRENSRKYMSYAIISALNSIAFRKFEKFDHNDYYLIPKNTSYLTDILLRNVKIFEKGNSYITNISIMYKEVLDVNSNEIKFNPYIYKKGTLKNMFGHLDLDFKKNKKTFNFNTNTITELMLYVNKLRIIQ
jgi:hypothetical protein|tara:strand:+ start:198 stop:1316 length:1119 start_codon:yes stop_codon:yes gene_type:complete